MDYEGIFANGAVVDATRPRTSGIPQNAHTMKLQKEPRLDFEKIRKILAGEQVQSLSKDAQND